MNQIVKPYFRDDILKEACQRFNIEYSGIKLIKGNSNLIYDCGNKILRLSHSKIRSAQDIAVEIDWMNFLRHQQLPVVKLIPSNTNKEIEIIGTDDHFSIVCFEKIMGSKIKPSDWNQQHFQRLGTLTGRLHKTGQQYQEKNLPYRNWDEIAEFKSHIYLKEDHLKLHNKLVNEFQSFPKSPQHYGLIHYDIHQGNYLMTKGSPPIILFDFEMVCKSWYINDVATVVYYAKNFPTARNEADFESRFLQHFWQGYEKEYQLPVSEQEKIPKFLLYRDLLVLGFVRKIWDLNNLQDGQISYINRLEQSIDHRRRIFIKR